MGAAGSGSRVGQGRARVGLQPGLPPGRGGCLLRSRRAPRTEGSWGAAAGGPRPSAGMAVPRPPRWRGGLGARARPKAASGHLAFAGCPRAGRTLVAERGAPPLGCLLLSKGLPAQEGAAGAVHTGLAKVLWRTCQALSPPLSPPSWTALPGPAERCPP